MHKSDSLFQLNEYTEAFFLYEYFGIVQERISLGKDTVYPDNEKSAAVKCAYRAYLDLCRTLEYEKKVEKNEQLQEENKVRDEVLKICNKIAEALLSEEMMEDRIKKAYHVFYDDSGQYKNVLSCVADNTADIAKRCGKPFYFGQAQKWVNMTVKYLWLVGIIKDIELSSFDIPIDSLIMEAASNDLLVRFPRNNKTYNTSYNPSKIDTSKWKEYSENATMPWSKLDKAEYEKIQKCIRNNVHNIVDWENKAWIAQSVLNTEDNKKPLFKINLEPQKLGE